MAEVIEFQTTEVCGVDLYDCDCLPPNATIWEKCKVNHSGRYVRESDYNALLERHRRLVAITKKALPLVISGASYDALKAALAEEVE